MATSKRIIMLMSEFASGGQLVVESLDQLDEHTRAELETIFEDTSLDRFSEETGLGLHELSQQVTYQTRDGTKTGTVASMLSHEDCPVGTWARNKYSKEGVAGVQRLFTNLHDMDPGVSVKFSEQTLAPETYTSESLGESKKK
jgi:hypothetical protein